MSNLTNKAYRTLSGYTITATQKAIKEIETSIQKGELVDLMTVRKKELENALKLIQEDSER